MDLKFKAYARKAGTISAAKVDEVTSVQGQNGNQLVANPGDYVVVDGTAPVSTFVDGKVGTKDVPYYAVIDGSTFEAEHDPVKAAKPDKE